MRLEFERDRILATVKANRDQHTADYEKAMKGYFLEATEQAEKIVEMAKQEREPEPGLDRFGMQGTTRYHFAPNRPESHLDDYNRAISMLENASGETIMLDETDYAHFMRDEWDWKARFQGTVETYSGKFRL